MFSTFPTRDHCPRFPQRNTPAASDFPLSFHSCPVKLYQPLRTKITSKEFKAITMKLFLSLLVLLGAAPAARAAFDAFATVQAEKFTSSEGSATILPCCVPNAPCCGEGGQAAAGLLDRSVLVYKDVDFQDGARRVDLRVASWDWFAPVGSINLHLDNTFGVPFLTIYTRSTPHYTWAVLSQYIPVAPTGVHDLYLSFNSDDHLDNGVVVDFDWFKFNKN